MSFFFLLLLKECVEDFKKEEAEARRNFLKDMVQFLDPKKHSQFWKVVNGERKSNCKSVVQPILRDDVIRER